MIRIEGRQNGRGIIIDSKALEDPNLSFRAKGLLAYLQSLPRGRASDVKGLESVSLEKKAAIETALKELVDSGYVTSTEEVGWSGTPSLDAGVQAVSRGALMDSLFGDLLRPGGSAERTTAPEERPAQASKKDEAKRRVQRIIDHLNMLRERSWDWAQFTPLSAKYAKNVEHISGRLRDGYSEQDLILVLDYLAAVDGGKEDSRRYFNCVTPFNTKNFESNLTMARDWEARGRRTPGRKTPGTSRGKAYYLGGEEKG
jgi:uncharacterized phage protein (TIGR02220 family)